MRTGLLVLALAACSPGSAPGPAWPKPASTAADGGETLEPRAAARSVATVSDDDDKPERAADDKPQAPEPATAAASPEKPTESAPAASASDANEPIVTEEIVIEIED